jgi:uncharacterized protein
VFIEIEDLKEEPLHVKHVYGAGEIRLDHEDAALIKPVAVDFVLMHKERDLRVDGRIETAIGFKCSRCVRESILPLSATYDLFYLPQPEWKSDNAEIELRYEEMEVGFYDGSRFDVDLMILEQIELAIPMKLLCREECRGLCYFCGADLNEGPCACNKQETDSRLAVLLDFRKKMDK